MRDVFAGRIIRFSACLAVMLILVGTVPAAAGDDPLVLEMKGYLAVFFNDDSGKQTVKLMPLPEAVEQGDILQYDIIGKNVSGKTLTNIKAAGKIPEGAFYIDNSAKCDLENTVSFSIDKGKIFSVPPLMETVTDPDGKEKQTAVSPTRYTDIRFTIKKLEPGQEFKSSYGVTVQ